MAMLQVNDVPPMNKTDAMKIKILEKKGEKEKEKKERKRKQRRAWIGRVEMHPAAEKTTQCGAEPSPPPHTPAMMNDKEQMSERTP